MKKNVYFFKKKGTGQHDAKKNSSWYRLLGVKKNVYFFFKKNDK
jgi:hypothetical protein